MLGIKFKDRSENTALKQSWARLLAYRQRTEFRPKTGNRNIWRPTARWVGDTANVPWGTWMRLTQDREEWHKKLDANTQHWVKSMLYDDDDWYETFTEKNFSNSQFVSYKSKLQDWN